ALTLAAVLVLGAGIVFAGSPARGLVGPDATELLDGVPHQIDPATLPAITVDVKAWDDSIAGPIAQGILVTLAEDLEIENQALLRGGESLPPAVDRGDAVTRVQ